MKRYIFSSILIAGLAGSLFAQNIELPDLTTVISGETVKAGADALPDFKDVMIVPEGSGTVVPVLPDVDTPSDADINTLKNEQTEKTIFAEGVIGGGYPSLFTGDFSVFRVSDTSPFKISFSHNSAVGYGNHSLGDGFSDRTTNLFIEKAFQKDKFGMKLDFGYEALSNGLQRHIQELTSINQDNYAGAGSLTWDVNDKFSTGVNAGLSFYNRYADVASGSFASASVLDINPELFAIWKINAFNIGFTGTYSMEADVAEEISKDILHRGEFNLNVQWENEIIKAYGKAGIVLGTNLNGNTVVVPFTVGVDSSFPVYFSNRRFGIAAEGGIDSSMNKISDLEKKYKFSGLLTMPSETSDWYGKVNFSIPLKESFTGTVNFEYRQTAFNNGHWQPFYDLNSSRTGIKGIYGYGFSEMQQFISDLSITYHYKVFSITGGWRSNWIDVPVLEAAHQLVLDVNFQSEDSKWGADLKGIWNLNGDATVPVINVEGFARLTTSVRAVLSIEDALKLFGGAERVYAGEYICRGGTVTALLKFFF